MKVLLHGDLSGAHLNLKGGLQEMGHEVLLVSHGNAWRELPADIQLGSSMKGWAGKAYRNVRQFTTLPAMRGHDVFQPVHFEIYNRKFGINRYLFEKLIKENEKTFLLSAGCESSLFDFYAKAHRFPQICSECKLKDLKSAVCRFEGQEERDFEDRILDQVNGVIPIAYEFAEGYRMKGQHNLCPTIPLPISTRDIKYQPNRPAGKLVIFHGLNRVGMKGTDIIRQAMLNVRDKYPGDVEIIIDGRMSLEKYLDLLSRVNIVIDQVYSSSIAMNALYSMALGKVLVGGALPEGLAEIGAASSPIVVIEPNVRDIEAKLVSLISRRTEIEKLGFESREFVEKFHDSQVIASKFLDVWRTH